MSQDGAVHALGNRRLLVYGQGADIMHVYGEPYTSQSLLTGAWHLADGTAPIYNSSREPGTSVWNHLVTSGGPVLGTIQQFVVPDEPALLSRLRLDVPATFRVELPEGYASYAPAADDEDERESRAAQRIIVAPDTARILFYPAGVRAFLALSCWGEGLRGARQGTHTVEIDVGPGEAYLAFAGGVHLPEVCRAVQRIRHIPYEEQRDRRLAADRALMARLDRSRQAAADLYLDAGTAALIAARVESVALLITAQQSADGGIVAGYPFPFAYARDQYGTCRGLLALGLREEVRRNLEFRYRKWLRFGNLANAESMGHDRIRHVHENDDVEQTAYTMLEALDYVDATGDRAFLTHVFPMLEWCLAAQIQHLRGGMLPFNGDETYVAGGFLPRSALNDGSFEATLLFIEAGKRLLAAARQNGLLSQDRLEGYAAARGEAEAMLRGNFLRNGVLVANAPERRAVSDQPSYRHGVCEGCGSGSWFGWTRRSRTGRYVCPRCAEAAALPAAESRAIELHSASLLPAFIGSTALSGDEQAQAIRRASAVFQERGYLPSGNGSQRAVGYDAALLLYGLTALHDPLAGRMRQYVLGLADATGAWSEYYERDQHRGTRCRPWESGISIAAVLHSLDGTA